MKKWLVMVCLTLLFVCSARLIPHVANFSPMICVALFAGALFDRRVAYVTVALGMLISDVLLAMVWHYPVFGSWSLFTYTGLMAITFVGTKLKNSHHSVMLSLLAALGSNLGFWIWTNFGVFVFSGMYGHGLSGLAECYAAAIPFLQHSTLSALSWIVIFIAALRVVPFVTTFSSRRGIL